MNCTKTMDLFYEYSGNEHGNVDSMSLFSQARVYIHAFFCPSCAQEIERFETLKSIMQDDFFPSSPNFEDSIMAKIDMEAEQTETVQNLVPGVLSTRGWVITGLIIFLSLATAFFGLDFKSIVLQTGNSFLLPVGITIGVVLTSYGAFFIGSHLKELSERFGL